MCGGELELSPDSSIAKCEYCGSVQTVPSQDNEKKLVLFERAERLRRSCEFDKAAGVYESIVADFRTESEAYWGLVLCKYGIEYVDDPATGKKVPTCHRSSFESVMDDANFELALENTDTIARRVYREEAKAIEELRKGIIEVSSTEEPYDIFINYKETDENGDRTLDSVIAQDIYDALCDKGYRVFFSRISLEDKLGTEYEPYIFAALNSAKLMLSVGTDYEHFNAVWVKNEWSRFLQLIEKGEKKTLIPCFKNIDAYDMPKGFAKLAAQDMGKVGAMQDLLRGVEKIIPRNTETVRVITEASKSSTEALEKRVYSLLTEGDWKKADICCEQLLNLDPENPHAYVGKLMMALKLKAFEDLANCSQPFDQNENYKKAVAYADTHLSAQLQDYVEHIKERNELERKCKEEQAKKTARKVKKVCAIVIPTAIALIALVLLITKVFLPSMNYNKAEKLIAAGEYAEAAEIFLKLDSYKNSDSRYVEVKYDLAESLMQTGEYEKAMEIYLQFDDIASAQQASYTYGEALQAEGDFENAAEAFSSGGEYSDASEKAKEAKYLWAKELLAKGDFAAADEKFAELGEYKDSAACIEKIKLQSLVNAEVGDVVKIGKSGHAYKKDITWIVLDKIDNKMLVISENILEKSAYDGNDLYKNVWTYNDQSSEWASSDICESLQRHVGDLETYSNYFNAEETQIILDSYIHTPNNPKYDTSGGPDTVNKLFLLSIDEAEKYFASDEERAAKLYGNDECRWWLRSPGSGTYTSAYVKFDGGIALQGYNTTEEDIGVRPAMWIDVSSLVQ